MTTEMAFPTTHQFIIIIYILMVKSIDGKIAIEKKYLTCNSDIDLKIKISSGLTIKSHQSLGYPLVNLN